MKPINRRSMTERIRIKQIIPADNALGEEVGEWRPIHAGWLWAKVEPIRSRELVAAGQLQSAGDTRVVIDFRADVLASMRVEWRQKDYDIIGEPIDIEARRQWLEMTCTTGLRDGR